MIKKIKILMIVPMICLPVFFMMWCSSADVYKAAAKGDIEAVKVFLEKAPGSINARDNEGYTLLHHAAEKGKKDIVEMLIARGAEVDEQTYDQRAYTALQLAACEGRLETAGLLVEKGADVNKKARSSRYVTWNALTAAADNGHKEMVAFLLQKGAAVKQSDNSKVNALWFAVDRGYQDIAALLLENGALANIKAGNYRGPLHIAVDRGQEELVKLLLKHGADVNSSCAGGIKPLHSINYWRKEHKGIIRLLLDNGADVNAADANDDTPLHYAAYKGFKEIAELLLARGADIEKENHLGETPLEVAVRRGRKAVVGLFLSMHTAARLGDLEAITSLVKKYPQMINTRDEDLKTPLHHAVENNRLKIAGLLIANGAAVDSLCKYKRTDLLHGVIARLLVPKDGRLKRETYEKTPLGIAVQKGYGRMAQLLSSRGTAQ